MARACKAGGSISGRIVILACFIFFASAVSAQRIPVVVHIVSDDPDAVSDATIIAAISDLNDAFANSGSYASAIGVNTGISFCLARKDPNGGITNGITRTNSLYADFDVDIENTRMKNLISWDTRQYLNIWYVKELKSEIFPEFLCGKWSRMKEGGYATYPGGGDFRDGVVVTGFGILLVHEVGHYLGLLHTFTRNNCGNNDCSVDGDGICDTPPQSVFGGSCTSPQNSCTTDTLSGFGTDQPDLNANFMGYSTCANMFTNGQATKMKTVLSTVRSSLLADNKCDPPCGETMRASFTRNNWAPTPGSTITFTSTSSGAVNYEWTIDGTTVGGNNPIMSHTFSANGKYAVGLKVYNASTSCYASYTHYVIVNCGVVARFYPDKRIIASKDPFLLDTIQFKGRSVNASSYQWLMSNDTGMVETVVGTGADLEYVFKNSGNYKVRLIASNGSCADTTETFSFRVEDPTFDGTVTIFNVDCFQETKLRFSLYVCNNGYATMPKGIPISFYDGDPRVPGSVKLDTTFIYPDAVTGKCCGPSYTMVIDVKKAKFNTLHVAFNDNGTVLPLSYPSTAVQELNYQDNIALISGFRYRASIVPATATLEPNDTLRVRGLGLPSPTVQYTWSPVPELSCTNCPAPIFTAGKKDVRLQLVTRSVYGCTDTGYADIKVPEVEDLTGTIRTIDCYRNDSLLVGFEVCNLYRRGFVPKGLKVSFYDADPAAGGKLMGQYVVPANSTGTCQSYSHVIPGKGPLRLYMAVNDKGTSPFSLPNDSILNEVGYGNNVSSLQDTLDTVAVVPADTAILRKSTVALSIASTVFDPSSITWSSGPPNTISCTTCPSPRVTVNADGIVSLQMNNRYGCAIKGQARVRVLPADMTINITGTECYSNTKTLVRFQVCMGNGYDSLFANIPVSFYGADPYTAKQTLLDAVFLTGVPRAGRCDTFTAIVNSPRGTEIYAAVNDKGVGALFPDAAYQETNFRNNTDSAIAPKFTISVFPADTSVYRNSTVQLRTSVTGGTLTGLSWEPPFTLSCTTCGAPSVTVPYSQLIIVNAKNQNLCTSSDTADIKTFSDGPVNIPNAFTPNGDGLNDVFYVLGSRDIEVVKEFGIYDRYGQIVFRVTNVPPNNPVYGWNGVYKDGRTMQSSSYVYNILIRFRDGREQRFKGTVTVIR